MRGVLIFLAQPISVELGQGHLRTHRSEEHTSELQSQSNLVCRLLLEKKTSSPVARLYVDASCLLRSVLVASHVRRLLLSHLLYAAACHPPAPRRYHGGSTAGICPAVG